MMLRSPVQLRARLRALPGPLMVALVVIAAAAGVYLLQHGTFAPNAVGYAEAVRHVIAPVATGRIDSVAVYVGQGVKAGETIAVLEGRAVRLARERAVAELAKLTADVAATAQTQEFRVTRSELGLLKARAGERGDRAELKEIAERLDRLDSLLARQMVAATEDERAREKLSALTARVQTYDQAMHRGQAGLTPRAVDDHDHERAIELHVAPARLAVVAQETALREIELAIEQLTLRAPVDGVVSTISHFTGDIVKGGEEVAVLVTSRPGFIVAVVPERGAARLKQGTRADVRRGTFGYTSLVGHVVEIAPEIDEVIPRARPSPSIPAWGRRVGIQLDGAPEILPGEAFHVAFR
jgi:multidrug resistance efflux pump